MDTSPPLLHLALKDINILSGELPRLPLDQPVPNSVLSRRRHAISSGGDSPYRSRPRMKRRGAISYDDTDACARYIRFLGKYNNYYSLYRVHCLCKFPVIGEALAQKDKTCKDINWSELVLVNESKSLTEMHFWATFYPAL